MKKLLITLLVLILLVGLYFLAARFVPALCGHWETEQVDSVPATCSINGRTAGLRCRWCGTFVEGHELTPTIPHEFIETIEKENNCTEDGIVKQVCSQCGYTTTKSLPKTGHVFENTVIKEATCSEKGIERQICSICGFSQDVEIQEKPHAFSEEILKDSSCSEEGIKKKTCTICGYSLNEVIQKKPHSFGDWITTKESTCTSQGSRIRYCTKCNGSETSYIPSMGHTINNRTNACIRFDYVKEPSLTLTSSEKTEAEKIKYMAYDSVQHNKEKGYYEFLFTFLDENNNELKVPALVDLRIENENGEVVYRACLPVRTSDFGLWSNAFSSHIQACVKIYEEDIKPSDSTSGKLYYKVYHKSWGSFKEDSVSIYDLPKYNPISEYSAFLKNYPFAKESINTLLTDYYSFRITTDFEAKTLFDPVQGSFQYSKNGDKWSLDITTLDAFGNESEYKIIVDDTSTTFCDYTQKVASKSISLSQLEGYEYVIKCMNPLISNSNPNDFGEKEINGYKCKYLTYRTDNIGTVIYYFNNNRLAFIEIDGQTFRTELSDSYNYSAFTYPSSFKTY